MFHSKLSYAVVAVGIILAAAVYWTLAEKDRVLWRHDFEQAIAVDQQSLVNTLGSSQQALRAIVAFFEASKHVDSNEFSTFCRPLLNEYRYLQALEWIPRVESAERHRYESEMSEVLGRPFRFTERNDSGQLVAAATRQEYFPVYYLEPYAGNEKALGFDLGSSVSRRETLAKARYTGQAVATGKLILVQEDGDQPGILIVLPYFTADNRQSTVPKRDDPLQGYVLAVFRIGDMIARTIEPSVLSGINLLVYDGANLRESELLFGRGIESPELEITNQIELFGRIWTLQWQGTKDFLGGPASDAAIFATILVLFMCGCLTMIIENLVSRREDVEKEVALRIAELSENMKKLERANSALDEFAYVTAHDLKAPVRAIHSLCEWIEEDVYDATASVRENLGLIKSRTLRMQGLIDGILDYSRVGREAIVSERIDTSKIVQELIDEININGEIEFKTPAIMPTLFGPKIVFSRILDNLIDNAVKFNDKSQCKITISCEETPDQVTVSITDNGPGISAKYQDQVFGIFKVLQARDTLESTGIGLSIVKKLVEERNGKVWIESDGKNGSTFSFTWPK